MFSDIYSSSKSINSLNHLAYQACRIFIPQLKSPKWPPKKLDTFSTGHLLWSLLEMSNGRIYLCMKSTEDLFISMQESLGSNSFCLPWNSVDRDRTATLHPCPFFLSLRCSSKIAKLFFHTVVELICIRASAIIKGPEPLLLWISIILVTEVMIIIVSWTSRPNKTTFYPMKSLPTGQK